MIEVNWPPRDPEQVMSWVKQYKAPVVFYAREHLWQGRCIPTAAKIMRAAGAIVGLKQSAACPVDLTDAHSFGYPFVIGPVTKSLVVEAHSLGMKIGNFNSPTPKTWDKLRRWGADYLLTPTPLRARHYYDSTPR